jgi:hypothetical protein
MAAARRPRSTALRDVFTVDEPRWTRPLIPMIRPADPSQKNDRTDISLSKTRRNLELTIGDTLWKCRFLLQRRNSLSNPCLKSHCVYKMSPGETTDTVQNAVAAFSIPYNTFWMYIFVCYKTIMNSYRVILFLA